MRLLNCLESNKKIFKCKLLIKSNRINTQYLCSHKAPPAKLHQPTRPSVEYGWNVPWLVSVSHDTQQCPGLHCHQIPKSLSHLSKCYEQCRNTWMNDYTDKLEYALQQGWVLLTTKETLNVLCSVLMHSALIQEAARAREKCKGKQAVKCFSSLIEYFSAS